jgi:hypothetical protein
MKKETFLLPLLCSWILTACIVRQPPESVANYGFTHDYTLPITETLPPTGRTVYDAAGASRHVVLDNPPPTPLPPTYSEIRDPLPRSAVAQRTVVAPTTTVVQEPAGAARTSQIQPVATAPGVAGSTPDVVVFGDTVDGGGVVTNTGFVTNTNAPGIINTNSFSVTNEVNVTNQNLVGFTNTNSFGAVGGTNTNQLSAGATNVINEAAGAPITNTNVTARPPQSFQTAPKQPVQTPQQQQQQAEPGLPPQQPQSFNQGAEPGVPALIPQNTQPAAPVQPAQPPPVQPQQPFGPAAEPR